MDSLVIQLNLKQMKNGQSHYLLHYEESDGQSHTFHMNLANPQIHLEKAMALK